MVIHSQLQASRAKLTIEHRSGKTSNILVKITGLVDQWRGMCTGLQDILLVMNQWNMDHVTNEEVRANIQLAVGPHEDLLTMVKRHKLQW